MTATRGTGPWQGDAAAPRLDGPARAVTKRRGAVSSRKGRVEPRVRRAWWLLALVVVLVGAGWWQVRAQESWQEIAPGVEMRMLRAPGSGTGVYALRVAARRVRVVAGATLDAPGWRKRAKAVAALNGGYFDTSGRSLGLRVGRGRRLHALHRADWGVFWTQNGRAHIQHTRDFRLAAHRPDEAVQCGPRLVVNGRVTTLKPQWARRTGLGIARDGRVVLAVSDAPLSFQSWAALWVARDGLNCRDALNLDGGGSTQLSLQTRGRSLEVSGSWPVPDAVVVY